MDSQDDTPPAVDGGGQPQEIVGRALNRNHGQVPATARDTNPSTGGLERPRWLLLAAAVGLASGFGEVAFQAGRRFVLDHWVRLGPHTTWMAPVAQLVVFLVIGLIAEAVWRGRPTRGVATLLLCLYAWLAMLPEMLAQPWIAKWAGALFITGLAVQAGRIVIDRLSALQRLCRKALPLLVGLLICAAVGTPAWLLWRERRMTAGVLPADGAPNILLVILDTVRQPSLSAYGYDEPTSPFLARFAAEGTRFDQAYAPSSWTLPTHASLFTGKWPHELSADWNTPLDDRDRTLAELFQGAGYATAAFVANYVYTMSETGLDRGFARYAGFRVSPAEVVASSALGRWIANQVWVRRLLGARDVLNRKRATHVRREFVTWAAATGSRPFFAVLNLFDAHEPYLPPKPFDKMFGGTRLPFDSRTFFRDRTVMLSRDSRKTLNPAEQEQQRAAYDGAIRFLDTQLELLFQSLAEEGVLDQTVVVITADHGEGLGEGGQFLHGDTFSALTTHVPLIIRYPAKVDRGRIISREVSLRDIPATLLELAGLNETVGRVPGSSLVALLQSDSTFRGTPSPALASWWAWRDTPRRNWALVRYPYRYVLQDDGSEALYNLQADPYETKDLLQDALPEPSAQASALRAVVDSIRAETDLSPRPHPWAETNPGRN